MDLDKYQSVAFTVFATIGGIIFLTLVSAVAVVFWIQAIAALKGMIQ